MCGFPDELGTQCHLNKDSSLKKKSDIKCTRRTIYFRSSHGELLQSDQSFFIADYLNWVFMMWIWERFEVNCILPRFTLPTSSLMWRGCQFLKVAIIYITLFTPTARGRGVGIIRHQKKALQFPRSQGIQRMANKKQHRFDKVSG